MLLNKIHLETSPGLDVGAAFGWLLVMYLRPPKEQDLCAAQSRRHWHPSREPVGQCEEERGLRESGYQDSEESGVRTALTPAATAPYDTGKAQCDQPGKLLGQKTSPANPDHPTKARDGQTECDDPESLSNCHVVLACRGFLDAVRVERGGQ